MILPGLVEAREQVLVEALVAQPVVEALSHQSSSINATPRNATDAPADVAQSQLARLRA